MSNDLAIDDTVVDPQSETNANWNKPNHKAFERDTEEPSGLEEASVEPTSETGIFALARRYASVSDALRMFGALGVATAMGLFMLEGVEVANDLYRFLTMIGFTTALTAAGLLMSMLLKEQRGSRIFIGLGLLSITANFTVFGALIYSIIPLDVISVSYPGFAHWTVASVSDIPLALAAGVLVLLPIVWLGFTVLARSERTWLSTALILGSAFMLVPVRQELWSAIIAIASAASVGYLVHKNHKNSLALKTPEGGFAVALLFVAPVIIAVRSLFLYEATGFLIVILAAGFYFCARHLLTQRSDSGLMTSFLTVLATLIALMFSISLANVLTYHLAHGWYVIISAATLLLLALDINKVSANRDLANTLCAVLVGIASGTLLLQALITSQSLITAISTAILLSVSVYGYLLKRPAIVGIAMTGVISIVAINATALWSVVLQTGWWGIGAAGAIAIVSGSMLDRAGTVVAVQN
ncbi:MAG: hypothetical protein V3U65_12510 [Granulosicoccaceae bacterium]